MRKNSGDKSQWLGILGGVTLLVLVCIFYSGSWLFASLGKMETRSTLQMSRENGARPDFTKKDLGNFVRDSHLDWSNPSGKYIVSRNGEKLTVETAIDKDLQKYVFDSLRRSKTLQAAAVILRVDNGQILTLANYEKQKEGTNGTTDNLALKAEFPAASLFKIISAAAAIEEKGFTPEKILFFRGRKHTLYKSQLRQTKGRWTVETTLRNAFSRSINPVFGKIGIYDLGNRLLTEYADRFLFNQEIPFEFPIEMSRIYVPVDDFGLAEIASGFNKKTLISPLHASLMSSAIANHGVMMTPWLISSIRSETGKVLYTATPSRLAKPLKEETAEGLKILMGETIKSGTGRKAFRSLRHKKVFSDIAMGAKTGTINDETGRYKYDWVTAYALPGGKKIGISIAIVVVHGEYLGTRAVEIAKRIINYYYNS